MRGTVLGVCLLLPVTGCVGTGTMREIAPDAGLEARYSAPADSVRAALGSALRSRGLRVEEETRLDSTTTMVIASKGANFFSYGELVRVLVQWSPDASQASARIVARSRYMLDLSGRADRTAPLLVQALDGAVGPEAIRPHPGEGVRGRREGENRAYVTGAAVAATDGTLHLSPDATATDERIPMAALTDVAVLRGSYSHRSEGAAIGMFVGLVAGLFIGYAAESTEGYRGSAAAVGGLLGMGVGALLGAGAGEMFRTQVWSDAHAPL